MATTDVADKIACYIEGHTTTSYNPAGAMKLTCPSCSTGFPVADDLAETFGATATCPSCGAEVAAKEGSMSDLDFAIDLNVEFTDSGVRPIPTRSGEKSRSDAIDTSTQSLEAAPPPPESGPTGVFAPGPASNAGLFGDFSGKSDEVSQLGDVDLTMIGTYHRTGRVLHHATDVVWTGRPREPGDAVDMSDPRAAGPGAHEAAARRSAVVTGAPTMAAVRPPPAPSFQAPPLDVPRKGAAPPPPPPPAAPASGASGMEELDFSSLLDDSLKGSAKNSLFGQDTNPFLDIGITSESVASRPAAAAPAPAASPGNGTGMTSSASFAPSDDTNTFFIEAPSVGKPSTTARAPSTAAPVEQDFASAGSYGIELSSPGLGPSLDSGHRANAPSSSRRSMDLPPSAIGESKAPRKAAQKPTSRGAIAAVGLLLVVVGVGVGAEALDYGWFFSKLWSEEASELPPPSDAGINATPIVPVVDAKADVPLADTPSAYDKAIKELDAKLKGDGATPALKDERLRLLLRYRYRWPGRFQRDEAKKEAVATLPNGSSIEAQFWEAMSRNLKPDEKREDVLRQAELLLFQIAVPRGRDLLYKAVVYRDQGKLENALSLIDLALKERPDDDWALFEKASILLKKSKLDDADAILDQLLRIRPDHREGRLLAAQVAISRKTPEAYARARELAEQAHKEATAQGDLHGEYEANLVRAVVYGLQNDLGKRLEALEGAAKYDPNDETLLLELAENDMKKGEAGKAVDRLHDCKEGVCSSVRYYRTYIKALVTNHKLPEAERVVEQAEKVYPDEADLLFLSGTVLEARGKLRLAARKYTMVKEKDSKYLEAYLRLAGIHTREKDFEAAIKVLDEASAVFEGAGKDSDAAMALLQERGNLLVKQGRLDNAREVFGKIVTAQPTNAPARFKLAKLLVELGYPQKSLIHFEKLYEQGKSDPEITITYAEALIRSGKPDRAIDELKAYLESNPNNLQGLVKLGNAYTQKQQYEEAMAVLERAAAMNPNFAPTYYFAGTAELGRQRQKAEEVERKQRNGEVVAEDERPDFTRAIIALTTAKDKDPENLEYREALAQALTESGIDRNLVAALEQYDTIIAAYQKAQRLSRPIRRNADVYYKRGLLGSKLGQPQAEVLKNFQDALDLDGERADFVARYAEELYRMQSKKVQGDRLVLEAKAYFDLVLTKHNPNHVRANFYMGKILLREWDKQSNKRPGDALHVRAMSHYERVLKNNGAEEFPEALKEYADIENDRQMYRLARSHYAEYLETYRRVYRKDPPNAAYVRDLIRNIK